MKTIAEILMTCIAAILLLAGCRPKVEACIIINHSSQIDSVIIDEPVSFEGGACSYIVHSTVCSWDFGDGTNGIGANVLHSYSSPGNYEVILTVKQKWKSDTKSKIITVVSANNQDYVGIWKVGRVCYCDTITHSICFSDTGYYFSNIVAVGINGLVIQNLFNNGVNVNAEVNQNRITIPLQIFNEDTFAGKGFLDMRHKRLLVLLDDTSPDSPNSLKICNLYFDKQ